MRKERNAFFEQQSYNQAYYPTPNMNMMPSVASTSSQSFFQGPNVSNNYQENDLEYRLAKMERQINRLDSRVSKLESNGQVSITDNYNDNTNMYMV
jgi:hypothetical protein